ncbi:aspartyl protease family protein [Henriciella sp.]|uniref:aspartyl protease family protein n=1 Tax=Henriciella sp. TaxID=1968823 RepID=UPI0026123510|nr:aspartyl protease family protein [Henriciella sp.]
MRHVKAAALGLVACKMFSLQAIGQQPDLGAVFSAPIDVERETRLTTVPIDVKAGKLLLNASVNDKDARMVFDTGSPTILSRQLANSLELEIVGQNTGVDANGTQVRMDVAVVESLVLGDVEFQHVPVLIFDFSRLSLGSCFIKDGILGSEIFPGSVWQVDLEAQEIRIAESAHDLGIADTASSTALHDFGYPHAPIVDYAIGRLEDKALFDTGSSEAVSLFEKAMNAPAMKKATVSRSRRTGRGIEGVSAGGKGEAMALNSIELKGLTLGSHKTGPLRAVSRSVPPSLIGAGLLSSYTVTLDYPGKRFILEPRAAPIPKKAASGYSVMFVEDEATVAQVFEKSEAAKAGLEFGDVVKSANGMSLVPDDEASRCEKALWLADEFDSSKSADLVVVRNGKDVAINVPATSD